jgi:hypothetical protein
MGEMNKLLNPSHPSLVKLSPSSGRIQSAYSSASLKSVSVETGSDPEISVDPHHHHHLSQKEPPPPPPHKVVVPIASQHEQASNLEGSGVVSPENPTASGSDNKNGAAKPVTTAAAAPAPTHPLKATTYAHLGQKYLHELEYMLTEFQKLERQLLGARAATRESEGSRERREKLHSFIVHLQETIQQIHTGRDLEAEGKSTLQDDPNQDAAMLKDSALLNLTAEKKEEETVQKLEEHILANLLPVKVRLKKQLAAQQGAKHNPAGMPVRGTTLVPAPDKVGKATFGAAVEESRRRASMDLATTPASLSTSAATLPQSQANSTSQFGKPLEGGGSNLTQKLHGPTLRSASTNRMLGDTIAPLGEKVGSSAVAAADSSKILYAGLAIGSDQHESSMTAASMAHNMVIKDPALMELARKHAEIDSDLSLGDLDMDEPDLIPSATPQIPTEESIAVEDHIRRLKKKRKRKKLRDEQTSRDLDCKKASQSKRKKRGPWPVEYMCALCNEVYSSTCDYNPWWALQQQECPKCHKTQVRELVLFRPA